VLSRKEFQKAILDEFIESFLAQEDVESLRERLKLKIGILLDPYINKIIEDCYKRVLIEIKRKEALLN
jgi:hypothetical protein